MLLPLPPGAKLYPVFPSVSLEEFERLIAKESDEVAAAFDLAGRLVLTPRRGTPIRVDFYPEEVERLKGTLVTHVHPLGGPFSGADVQFASDNDVVEMRIVLANGVLYRLLRPYGGWPEREAMRLAAERHLDRGRSIVSLLEKEYERFVFRDQRDAFAEIVVTIIEESWR